MNICPHCDSALNGNASRCPVCGRPYWRQGQTLKETDEETEEEMQGCLPALFWPLALSLLVTASLIVLGFAIQILSRLTDIRFKALWIFCSMAAGGAVFFLIFWFKRHKS